tara:strand:- start:23960 stop:24148 length:189 start_codon:yes stop_codon:yes gene_type:complete
MEKTTVELQDMLAILKVEKEEVRAICSFFHDMEEMEIAIFFDDAIGYTDKAIEIIESKLGLE